MQVKLCADQSLHGTLLALLGPTAAAALVASNQLFHSSTCLTMLRSRLVLDCSQAMLSHPYAMTFVQTHLRVGSGALQQQSPRPHTLLQGRPMLAEHGETRGAASQVVLSLGPVLVVPQERGAGAPMQGAVQRTCMGCGMHAVQRCMWRRM